VEREGRLREEIEERKRMFASVAGGVA
jgi:hypothetical protein